MIIEKYDKKVINRILKIYEEFISETQFSVTPNREKAWERFFLTINDNDGDLIVVMSEDGEIMGGACVYAIADWQNEIFGYVEKFFVSGKYRGTNAGRMLADEMSKWFDEKGAVFSFATSTANIGAGGQFKNLMAKYGYMDIGPTLAREYRNGKI